MTKHYEVHLYYTNSLTRKETLRGYHMQMLVVNNTKEEQYNTNLCLRLICFFFLAQNDTLTR